MQNVVMEPNSLKWVGSPCALQGPRIFYKAFKFHIHGKPRILSLGDFFFVRCEPEEPICIAELQLLWEEKTSKQLLSSSKLYFLPEDTPRGRAVSHGEDEIIAASEKVVVKLENLAKWTMSDFSEWKYGLEAMVLKPSIVKELCQNGQKQVLHKYRESTLNSGLNFKDVLNEKAELGEDEERVLVLSYPQYCRYRSVIARLREWPSSLVIEHVVLALGGIVSLGSSTHIFYCRETFNHPALPENGNISDKFGPTLKGRLRRNKLPLSQQHKAQGLCNAKEAGNTEDKTTVKAKTESKAFVTKPKSSSACKKVFAVKKSKLAAIEGSRVDEQAFLVALYKFMKERKTPIERIPYLGFKQTAQKLGGYELITARRQWKNVYNELGGNPGSTSAATCTRRHYERLILPYEKYMKGEEDKLIPQVKPRKQECGILDSGSKAQAIVTNHTKDEHQPEPKTDNFNSEKGLSSSQVPDNTEESPEFWQPPQMGNEKEEELHLSDKNETQDIYVQAMTPPSPAFSVKNGPSEHLSKDNSFQYSQEHHDECEFLEKHGSKVLENSNGLCQGTNLLLYQGKEQWQCSHPEYNVPKKQDLSVKTPSHVGMVLPNLKSKPLPNLKSKPLPTLKSKPLPTLKSKPLPTLTSKPLPTLKSKPLHSPTACNTLANEIDLPSKEESCFSHLPMLYPKGHLGIMSPLAKKKLLSQVSGTSFASNYSLGSALLMVKNKCLTKSPVELLPVEDSRVSSAETVVIKRPSVIQHAHSFKPPGVEERRLKHEDLKTDFCRTCKPSQFHLQEKHIIDSYPLSTNALKNMEKTGDDQKLYDSQAPNVFGNFHSCPHLHSIYQQTEYHMFKEPLTEYWKRKLFSGDCNNTQMSYPSSQHDSISLDYDRLLNKNEKIAPEDQARDLSLPKDSVHESSSIKAHSITHPDMKYPPLSSKNSHQTVNLDYHPKACRISPITISSQETAVETLPKYPDKEDDIVNPEMEELVQPILNTKYNMQNIAATRPLKRYQQDLENGVPEKKIQAMTPVPSTAGTEKTADSESVRLKSVDMSHAMHAYSHVENLILSPQSLIFPKLYPGTPFSQVQNVCNGLNSQIPDDMSHPFQFLKNSAIISPLRPRFEFHSTTDLQNLDKHRVWVSYDDFLSTLSSQSSFNLPQLSSEFPSPNMS
ncbi:AT-rich interactive domain-containing protein 5B-like isoform X2 [Brienomyrus brachyistius]|uniref:AT-rich interactive domain-containing protein 5B-like isoform X2 n=1 Tax=Brienomyrus brachyistius TaxID=42636 RepID=UPI0020B26CED|nr:AT-rich interactive domain-containing protein 5B-like isoform X2 [Brienomyrus brachyistius]